VERITNRLNQSKEGLSGIKNKPEEILYSDRNKISKHNHKFQELWNMICGPNLRIPWGRKRS
jgi:hypothetical protein